MSDWLTYSPISGHGNGIITITANTLSSLEDRVATIIVSNSQYSLSASTSVTQQGSQLTAITFENLTWVTDVPASGGTATKDNCTYSVTAYYSDGTTGDITEHVTVSGSLNVAATTTVDRHDAGTLTLSASYSEFTASANVTVYQTAPSITGISFNNLTWVTDIASTGGTATSANCSFNIYAYYTNGGSNYVDVTNAATVSGSLNVPSNSSFDRENVGTLNLTATYDIFSATTSVTAYQAAPSVTGINFTSLEWAIDVPASGGTATKDNCTYTIYAYYETSLSKDITDVAVITGSLEVSASRIKTLHSAGTLTLTATYSGFTTTGNVTAYQEAFDPSKEYLTFNILSDGTIKWITSWFSNARIIDYKLNNGEWTSITSTTEGVVINVVAGDKIQFRGNNGTYSDGSSEFNSFGGSALFEVEGNIMSLKEGDYFKNKLSIGTTYTFEALFRGCANLVSAENLILPATRVGEGCYGDMFQGCTKLATAPELPATTLDARCYQYMFEGCTSLTTAPKLPATKLTTWCYNGMFKDCTSLTAAPALPATKLADMCYYQMFKGCTSLTTAPELPANTLVENCYTFMFRNCTRLNYIKCLATDIHATACTSNWVNGVASTGTFVKASDMNNWPTGDSGIPSGWTVMNDSILLTGITISDLVWETNVPASGGTATKDNCSYRIIANYSGGTTSEVTSESIVNGSQIVESSQITSAHTAGTLTLTATYSGYSAEASVTIMQDGYNPPTPPSPTGSSEYLTFTILSAGTINWRASDTSITRTIEYKLNNGEWTSITSNTGSSAPTITVNSGDKLQFRGNNTEYKTSGSEYNSFSGSTAYFNLSGNILSLFYGDNFDAQTAPTIFELGGMFQSTNVIDAGGLLLPNIVRRYCYFEMFCFCTKLTKAPVLPATTLEFKCYCAMFYGCTSLNYIKCLATDISEKDCTEDWVNGVASTGTFVKASSMTSWTRGSYGIPTGWTVTNAS